MTDYERTVACLREYKLESLESGLDHCVEEERDALYKRASSSRSAVSAMRKAHSDLLRADEDARSYYASEILEDLLVPRELTPESVLYHRRSANVWAIAALMRAAGCRAFFEPSKKGT